MYKIVILVFNLKLKEKAKRTNFYYIFQWIQKLRIKLLSIKMSYLFF